MSGPSGDKFGHILLAGMTDDEIDTAVSSAYETFKTAVGNYPNREFVVGTTLHFGYYV